MCIRDRHQAGLDRRLQVLLGLHVLRVIVGAQPGEQGLLGLSLIHISEPTRPY